ncbi:ABC transporter substrate-binding protein [Paenibacillus swuensis]|uniref:ABC transporter substrate-binding protein n=1 Tax=Paenibacillus swuensis TaxID=1178515 RepID=UPI0018D2809A|nr:extracellular solute-binding protein [Paenibacillus swuensis]
MSERTDFMPGRKVAILLAMLFLTSILLSRSLDRAQIAKPAEVRAPAEFFSGEDRQDEASGLQVLRITVSLPPEAFRKLQDTTNQYSNEHKSIYIELENVPEEQSYDYLKSAAELGDTPDIMMVNHEVLQEFASLGFLQPVDTLLTNEAKAARLDIMMDQVRWNGYLWGIPVEADPYVLAWHKPSLEQLKLQPSVLTKEWWLRADTLLRNGASDTIPLYIQSSDPYAFISLIWALGGSWQENEINKLTFEDSRFYGGVTAAVQQGLAGYSDNEVWEFINLGKIKLMVTRLSDLKRNGGADVGYRSLGRSNVTRSGSLGGWIYGSSFALSANTKLVEEARKWINAVGAESILAEYMDEGLLMPAVKSAWTFPRIASPNDKDGQALRQGRVFEHQPDMKRKLDFLLLHLKKLGSGTPMEEFIIGLNQEWSPSQPHF